MGIKNSTLKVFVNLKENKAMVMVTKTIELWVEAYQRPGFFRFFVEGDNFGSSVIERRPDGSYWMINQNREGLAHKVIHEREIGEEEVKKTIRAILREREERRL